MISVATEDGSLDRRIQVRDCHIHGNGFRPVEVEEPLTETARQVAKRSASNDDFMDY